MFDVRSVRDVRGRVGRVLIAAAAGVSLLTPAVFGQEASARCAGGVTIEGRVLGVDGEPVRDAIVRLEKMVATPVAETKTDASGGFRFAAVPAASYRLSAEEGGLHTATIDVATPAGTCSEKVELMFAGEVGSAATGVARGSAAGTMEFADEPSFSIAGVTDWTAVGGHGSDSTLRTSESLASETRNLKAEDVGHDGAGVRGENESESQLRAAVGSSPGSFEANHKLGEFYLRARRYADAVRFLEAAGKINSTDDANQYDLVLAYEESGKVAEAGKLAHAALSHGQSADLYRVAGEVDEKLGDPLSAVHEFEQAVKLNASEQNYFAWGSELLLHRAVWQAQEVFRKGVGAYPKSVRMQTAMGAALFAGARYDAAAARLCEASDLDPADRGPYIFMGKIQMAAPDSLGCIEPKLARFVEQEPGNAEANYLFAMSILKRLEKVPDQEALQRAQGLLSKAVALDPKCSEAYLQLGIIAASQKAYDSAIDFYKKAIAADPTLADAYYRLGVAYDRTAQPERARDQFRLHDQIKQKQAEATEQQRRDVKQFLVVLSGKAEGQEMP